MGLTEEEIHILKNASAEDIRRAGEAAIAKLYQDAGYVPVDHGWVPAASIYPVLDSSGEQGTYIERPTSNMILSTDHGPDIEVDSKAPYLDTSGESQAWVDPGDITQLPPEMG